MAKQWCVAEDGTLDDVAEETREDAADGADLTKVVEEVEQK